MQILKKLTFIFLVSPLMAFGSEKSDFHYHDSLTGSKVNFKTHWKGEKSVPKSLPILVLAGHADSQGIAGAGTAGEAVAIKGKSPMNPKISDELFWNLKVRDAVVRLGKKRGLNISLYDPTNRNIIDGNNKITNWSKGAMHARKGGYPIEIHFDSYGEYGFGSGLIPALISDLNNVDESLANEFGRYPLFFRGGLGAPRRGIRVLEIGKLEGDLEKKLRDNRISPHIIDKIGSRIVECLIAGIHPEKANQRHY